jgi:hypothetical protein
MTAPSKWQRPTQPSGSKSRSFGVGYLVACPALSALVMAGVRFYAHHIGVFGGLLTIAGMYIVARWYDRRQSNDEILSEERSDVNSFVLAHLPVSRNKGHARAVAISRKVPAAGHFPLLQENKR